jgi:amino acid adenylation domain-containing protein
MTMMHGKSSEAGVSPAQQQLERLLDSSVRARPVGPIPRLPPGSQVPLSAAQARIWSGCRTYPESAESNVVGPPLDLTIEASRELVDAALRTVMDRHDALRLRIVEVDGAPLQVTLAGLAPPLAWHDLRGLPAAEAALRAAEIGHRAAQTPFVLEAAPLFRVAAVRLTGHDLRLVVVAHHIILDGTSLDLVEAELHALLVRGALGPAPAVGYLDYVAWEGGQVDERRLAQPLDYWRHKLAGPLPLLDVPKDRPWVTARDRGGHAVACAIPRAVVARARALTAAEGTTLFVTLLAAYKVLLLRLGGQPDVIVGTELAGRDHPAAEALAGSFARIVALRTDLGGRPSFREVLRRVQATVVEAQDHQAVPFDRIVAELKLPCGPSGSPVFQTVFGLRTAGGAPAYDSGTSTWELSLSLTEVGADVSGSLAYAPELFDEATIARYATLYTTLLAAAVAAPDRAVGEYALLSAEAQARILYGLRTPVRLEIPYATLAAPFELQVRRTPDAIALTGDGGTLTYRALNARANQLAHFLRAHGVGPGRWVAVCMARGVAAVTALYAIAKTGAAYVPLDPRAPGDRIWRQLHDTEARWVITHAAARARVPAGPWQTICFEEVAAQLAGRPAEDVPCAGPASQLAYVMYTAGTGGRPEAVAFPVEAALSSVFWLQRCFPVMVGDHHVWKTPYSVDASLWELFWPLYFGGTLVVCRPEGHLDPAYLAGLIEQHGVTSACFAPAMLQAFLDELAPGRCRSLRWVLCGGEAVTPRLRDACHARLGATLVNSYGTTETHAVTLMELAPHPGCPRVPLGRPIAAYRLYVLDPELQPQPIGVAGELYIGGEVGLAHGYHRRPSLTAERFLPDPFGPAGTRMVRTGDLCRYDDAGVLEFLGRCDTQVKILGVRIELAEIEAALCEHPAVRSAIVLSIGGDGDRLVGFVVPADPAWLDVPDVLQHAARFLPRHMIPAVLVAIDEIPTTARGKVDREALVARWRAVPAAEVVAPATDS